MIKEISWGDYQMFSQKEANVEDLQKRAKLAWHLSHIQLISLCLGAMLLGVNTTIVVTQPESESILGAGLGVIVAAIIVFNVLYAVRKDR